MIRSLRSLTDWSRQTLNTLSLLSQLSLDVTWFLPFNSLRSNDLDVFHFERRPKIRLVVVSFKLWWLDSFLWKLLVVTDIWFVEQTLHQFAKIWIWFQNLKMIFIYQFLFAGTMLKLKTFHIAFLFWIVVLFINAVSHRFTLCIFKLFEFLNLVNFCLRKFDVFVQRFLNCFLNASFENSINLIKTLNIVLLRLKSSVLLKFFFCTLRCRRSLRLLVVVKIVLYISILYQILDQILLLEFKIFLVLGQVRRRTEECWFLLIEIFGKDLNVCHVERGHLFICSLKF